MAVARRGRADLAGQRRRQLTQFGRAVAGHGVDAFAGAPAKLAKPFLTHADARRHHAALHRRSGTQHEVLEDGSITDVAGGGQHPFQAKEAPVGPNRR